MASKPPSVPAKTTVRQPERAVAVDVPEAIVEPADTFAPWWPTVRPDLERAALGAAGRAFLTSWAPPPAGDLRALDQLAVRAVDAAAAVAEDREADSRDRAFAAVAACGVVEAVAVAHEASAQRRERWIAGVTRAVGAVVTLAVVSRWLTSRG